MLSCVKRSEDEVEADEGWYSRGCSEERLAMSQGEGDGEMRAPVDPNNPEQVAQYISLYLRNKVLPVRRTQGKSSDCFTHRISQTD